MKKISVFVCHCWKKVNIILLQYFVSSAEAAENEVKTCYILKPFPAGIAIYNSELLLNGIITQRLEYER